MKSHIPLQIDTRVFSVVVEADAAYFQIEAALLLTLYNLSSTLFFVLKELIAEFLVKSND